MLRVRENYFAAVATAVLGVAIMAAVRLGFARGLELSIGYGMPIVIVGWFGRRKVLWITAATLAAITVIKTATLAPAGEQDAAHVLIRFSGLLVILDLAVVSWVTDLWIVGSRRNIEQVARLEAGNAELAAREEEIARQNEELQSQTEELERQSEELRSVNAELAHRQKSLEVLLLLSRSLTVDLTRAEVLTGICETLGQLVSDHDAGAAVLEREGDQLLLRCHFGFGPGGPREPSVPLSHSFAALVLSRGRTGYLEDTGLRSDLQIPQPMMGEQFKSVLAVPLRVGGHSIGTLETYVRGPMHWSDDHVTLVESLAAQASVSLEAAELFEQVDHARARYETVLRTVPIAVASCDAEGTDVRLNPTGAQLFSLSADVDISRELLRGVVRLLRNGVELPVSQYPMMVSAREGRELYRDELELLADNGRRLVLLCNARPTRDADGQITGAVASFVDITPQKDLQRELDQRRREAEEASVRKTRFLAAVSHDIRTPANAIGLLAELTRRTASNPSMLGEIPELAREMHSSAMSLVNLLGDVLDVARFDSGRIELQESDFLLSELLLEEVTNLQPLAREKGLILQCSASPNQIRLRTDRIKLARVLGNLIGNAIKFTESGNVGIEAQIVEQGAVHLIVSDTGVGIPPEHLNHIFDEFFQLRNPERDRSKGTGLGLTICKRLVDAMGGDIQVQSTVGQGSRFTVTFPAAVVAQPAPTEFA